VLRGATGLGAAVMLVTALAAATTHQARAGDANQILRRMSDFLAGQQNLSASFDSDVEVITPEVQKIAFASSDRFQISRPDKLRISRTGVYDGKIATVYGKNLNGYAQANASGSIDELVDRLRDKLGVVLPGADLLSIRSMYLSPRHSRSFQNRVPGLVSSSGPCDLQQLRSRRWVMSVGRSPRMVILSHVRIFRWPTKQSIL
jgi:hypothetical protein